MCRSLIIVTVVIAVLIMAKVVVHTGRLAQAGADVVQPFKAPRGVSYPCHDRCSMMKINTQCDVTVPDESMCKCEVEDIIGMRLNVVTFEVDANERWTLMR